MHSPVDPFDLPHDRLYDPRSHLWVKRDESTGRVMVGINTIGLDVLGELAFVALNELGTAVRRGETVGSLEAAKMTVEIISPVSGIIIGRNEAVLRDPLRVNRDPYGEGWLFSLDPTDWQSEAAHLVDTTGLPDYVAQARKALESDRDLG